MVCYHIGAHLDVLLHEVVHVHEDQVHHNCCVRQVEGVGHTHYCSHSHGLLDVDTGKTTHHCSHLHKLCNNITLINYELFCYHHSQMIEVVVEDCSQ